ncbi:MAG: ABC transporter permease subunit [Actinomycetia bacterium]|nr:ABC transporter permease subunit [Actinomycetes bacterium]
MTTVGLDAAGASHAFDDASKRYVPPWRNPWRRPYVLASITWAYVLWSLVPVLISIQFSFNNSRSRSSWVGFTTDWYLGTNDPNSPANGASIAQDPALLRSLENSVTLAVMTTLLTVPIGTALALGLTRWRSRASTVSNGISLFPLVTPELVLGSALFLVFNTMYSSIPLGRPAMLLGHITFSISFILVIVRSRLVSIGPEFETAAQDLGATRIQAIRTVLLPMLVPAIFASAMITFAASLDDFVVSNFLYLDAKNITVPILLYSAVKAAPSPALNALATLLLLGTLAALLVTYLVLRLRRRGDGGSALDDLADIEM